MAFTTNKHVNKNRWRESTNPVQKNSTPIVKTNPTNNFTPQMTKEIERKAKNNIPLQIKTPEKQALYDSYKKAINSTPTKSHGIGNPAPGYSDDDYRSPMYGKIPTNMAPEMYKNNPNMPVAGQPSTGAQPTNSFDMGAFTDMFGNLQTGFDKKFGDMQSMYEGRMSALEKLIQDLKNTNSYNSSQQQGQTNTSQGVYDGSHIYTAPNQGNTVGYTQNNNAVNQTLHKYLNNIWNGGF